jgi:hypothetical protein
MGRYQDKWGAGHDKSVNNNSPVDHLNTTLETIIEMSLSTTTSKDLSF